ncbi:MAG: glycosyltransferase family 39 protein [Brachyspira sp.]|nr:glycosyltransferase family 39 protein [Brachyspira sp.]
MTFDKITDYVKKHADFFTILGLCVLFYFIFFHNIGSYALMDVDETRYVSMARDMYNTKDFMTLYLNGEYFFEKPPLYFWVECLSFAFFNKVNEFTARFPVAMCGMLTSFLIYFAGRKQVSREYGVVASLVLATCFEYVILAKFAILDIVVAACVGFSIMCGFKTFFCAEENKKFFWWFFYIFSGLAVMAKGLPGFIAPFGTMFIACLLTKKVKEGFKPQYFGIGIILFLLFVLPWHMIMLKMHDPMFYEEYIIKHHLERFLNSNEIDRAQPFWFYIVTLFWGLIPWIFSVIAVIIAKLREFNFKKLKDIKVNIDFDRFTNPEKFLFLNWVAFLFIMLFFSSSKTKLITYILPAYVFAAPIIGFIWYNYIKAGERKTAINLSVYIWGGFCIVAAITAMFTQYFLPAQLYADILPAKWLCIFIVLFSGIFSILFALKDKRGGVFFTYVIFTLLVSAFCTKLFFEIDYKFGQDDLMKFTKYARSKGTELVSFGDTRRYSLLYYSGYHIDYIEQTTTDNLEEELEKKDSYISIRKKYLDQYAKNLDYDVVIEGRKYVLIKSK